MTIVAQVDRPGDIRADVVPFHHILRGPTGVNKNTAAVVPRNQVTRPFYRTPNRIADPPMDDHAVPRIAQVDRPGDIRANVVPLHHVPRGAAAHDINPAVVPRNQIAHPDRGSANRAVGHLQDAHAICPVAQGSRAGDVRADVVPFEDIASIGLQQNPVIGKTIDHQTLHHAASSVYSQPGHIGTRAAAVQFDDRRAGKVRLGRSIDSHRIGDRRQWRARNEGVRPSTGNVEMDAVGAGQGIGFFDGRAQRAVAATVVTDAIPRIGISSIQHRVDREGGNPLEQVGCPGIGRSRVILGCPHQNLAIDQPHRIAELISHTRDRSRIEKRLQQRASRVKQISRTGIHRTRVVTDGTNQDLITRQRHRPTELVTQPRSRIEKGMLQIPSHVEQIDRPRNRRPCVVTGCPHQHMVICQCH